VEGASTQKAYALYHATATPLVSLHLLFAHRLEDGRVDPDRLARQVEHVVPPGLLELDAHARHALLEQRVLRLHAVLLFPVRPFNGGGENFLQVRLRLRQLGLVAHTVS